MVAPVGSDRALVVNTGDNFSFRQQPSRGLTSMYLKTFSLFDAACVAVGMSELELGPDIVSAAREGAPPLVATNVMDERWAEILKPFILAQRNGMRILVVSVLDPELMATNPDLNIMLSDPVLAVKEIRDSTAHDMLVLVAHAKLHRAEDISAEIGGVDVVVQAADLQSPVCRSMDASGPGGEGTVFMANRKQGVTVSFADLTRRPGGFILLNQGALTVAMQEPEDPDTLLLMEAYEVWTRKDKLRRPEDGYYVQVGSDFNYMEFLKQKNANVGHGHAD